MDVEVHGWTVAREPSPDRQRTAPLVEAPTYTAPLWDRRKRPGREGDGRSVAGWTDASEADTMLQVVVSMRHVVNPQLKVLLACGQEGVQHDQKSDQKVDCNCLTPSGMVHPVFRYMDTHRPVRVGGGYRPPQDRPPPVVCS